MKLMTSELVKSVASMYVIIIITIIIILFI